MFFVAVLIFSVGLVAAQPYDLRLSMTSDGYVGAGRNYNLSSPNTLYVTAEDKSLDNQVDDVRILAYFGAESWHLSFSSFRAGRNIVPGFFDNAEQWPFESAGHPGLSVSGNGRSCSRVTGSFTVHEAVYTGNSANGFTVVRFSASFEQHCENSSSGIYGTVFYNSAYNGPTVTVSGRVLDPRTGLPMASFPVSLDGSATRQTTTDSQGYYSFPDLISGGNYRAAPTNAAVIARPANHLIRRALSDQIANFYAYQAYTIAGRVRDSAGAPVPQLEMRIFSNGTLSTALTDQNGVFSFPNLTSKASYTISSIQDRYTITPNFIRFDRLDSDQFLELNATPRPRQIYGRVVDSRGWPLSDVEVRLTGSVNAVTRSNGSGAFAFYDLQQGGSFVVTATRAGLTFSPPERVVSNMINDTNVSFATSVPIVRTRAHLDFDGDGKDDIGVWRPETGAWYLLGSATNVVSSIQFGLPTDIIVPEQWNQDFVTDFAVFRDGLWFVRRFSFDLVTYRFGLPGDIPVPADYDGDRQANLAVFRPSNGYWYIRKWPADETIRFGMAGDKPFAADFDGDMLADIAVFRPSNGTWYIKTPTDVLIYEFGLPGDWPVPADYDGDGITDVAVFRNGVWHVQNSSGGYSSRNFGLPGDRPVPADYDGDWKSDFAVFRNGVWYIERSSNGMTEVSFGLSGDKPLVTALLPQ